MRNKIRLMLFATFMLTASLESTVRAENSNTIKIGAVLPLTGAFAAEGNAFREGIELATYEVNQASGINGQKLEVITEDSQYTGRVAYSAAKKLLDVDHVIASVTASFTEVSVIGPEFQKAKKPIINLWDSSEEIEKIGNFVFGIGTWTPSSGELSAKYARESLKAKTAALIYFNNPWSQACGEYFKNAFVAGGGKIIDTQILNDTDTDFRTVLTRVRALNPEVVYAPVSDHPLAFFSQYKQMGLVAPLITSDVITKAILDENAKAVEGYYQTLTVDPSSEATTQMSSAYRGKFKKQPDQLLLTSLGYDGIMLLVQAIKVVGEDPQKIESYLHSVKNYDGSSGLITINEKGSSRKLVNMFQIRDGAMNMVF